MLILLLSAGVYLKPEKQKERKKERKNISIEYSSYNFASAKHRINFKLARKIVICLARISKQECCPISHMKKETSHHKKSERQLLEPKHAFNNQMDVHVCFFQKIQQN